MAGPVTSGAALRKGNGVEIVLSPPIEFILKQSKSFQRQLVTDLPELFTMFGPVMGEIESEQWATEARGSWAPLAPSTVEQKAREGWPPDILVRTGDLRDSLTDPARALEVHLVEATYGTDVSYAGYHQDGTDRMPARQVIPDPLPVDLRRKLEARMVFWINRIAARTFGRI